MDLFLCDNCDTLASVEVIGDTLKIAKCNCVRTTIWETPEAE